MQEMLYGLGKVLIPYVRAGAFLENLSDRGTWVEYFAEWERGDGMVGILAEWLRDGHVTEDDFDDIMLPHLPEIIHQAIDALADEVIIKWKPDKFEKVDGTEESDEAGKRPLITESGSAPMSDELKEQFKKTSDDR